MPTNFTKMKYNGVIYRVGILLLKTIFLRNIFNISIVQIDGDGVTFN